MQQDKNTKIDIKKDALDIVFQNEDFAIINKKRGMASAPLKKGDDSLLTLFLQHNLLKEKVCGKKEIEEGLLHRLDTPTSGLILIAKNQNIYDILTSMQDKDMIEKEYLAICNVVPNQAFHQPQISYQTSYCQFNIISSFLPYGRRGARVKMHFPYNKPKNGHIKNNHTNKKEFKTYKTHVLIKEEEGAEIAKKLFGLKQNKKDKTDTKELENICCHCTLTRGYRHQVRCHLASIGLPIKGDGLYNSIYIEENKKDIEKLSSSHNYPLHLYATRISFPSPYNSDCELSFSLLPLNKKNL